jgi:putative NADH-flavin reductase
MKVARYGAAGKSGSRILTELVSRRHQVTAIVRDPSKFPNPGPGVVVKQDGTS